MHFLPKNTVLGRLRLIEEWDYYDGPSLLVAQNAAGLIFVAMWAKQTEDEDVWLYAGVSESRLEAIGSGSLSLRDAFLRVEDERVFRVTTPRRTGQSEVEILSPNELPPEQLPLETDYVSVSVDGPLAQVESLPSIHQAAIRHVVAGKAFDVEAITDVLKYWRRVFSNGMESFGVSGSLVPVEAGVSSFKVSLSVNDPQITGRVVEKIRTVIQLAISSAPLEEFADLELDLAHLAALFNALAQHEVRLEITVAESSSLALTLSPAATPSIERTYARFVEAGRLPTDKVPQADDIGKVFALLELKASNAEVNPQSLGVVRRQVAYYHQACRLLEFLNEDNELTSAGRQLMRLEREHRLRTTAIQFEQSDCGYAWIRWSNVRSLPEVDEATAEQFLRESSFLGKTTAPRRAATLRAWHRTLVPYHYMYDRGPR